MKKLLLLLFLIPDLVLAARCGASVDIVSSSSAITYSSTLGKEITELCKRKDIMHVRYFIFEEEDRSWENQRRVGSSMSMIMRDYCNFDKQIKNDITTGYLVCEFKDNR